MKILAFTDLHGRLDGFIRIEQEIEQADLILLAGDITNFGHSTEMDLVLSELRKINSNILAVHGNCDYPDVLESLEQRDISLHSRVLVYKQIQFAGLGGSTACPGKTPSEYSEPDLKVLLQITREQMDPALLTVFVTHQPPSGTINDRIANGRHVGSKAVREFIETTQPDICITGHIHEGIGEDHIGKTLVINPGPFQIGNYLNLDIDSGAINFEIRNIQI